MRRGKVERTLRKDEVESRAVNPKKKSRVSVLGSQIKGAIQVLRNQMPKEYI